MYITTHFFASLGGNGGLINQFQAAAGGARVFAALMAIIILQNLTNEHYRVFFRRNLHANNLLLE